MSVKRFPRKWMLVHVLVAAFALMTFERSALAANCSTLTGLTNPIVIESGDTQEPLLKGLGRKLRDSTSMPMSILYLLTGSCTLVPDLYMGAGVKKLPVGTVVSYLPSIAEDPNFDPVNSTSPTCTIDTVGGVPVDLGISAVFASACVATPPPAGIGLFSGPIQAYTFITPKASKATAITAEEAYFTFGFGQPGMVNPWNDETQMFIRTPTKSTIVSLGNEIGVPAAKWKGVPQGASAQVLNLVATSTTPQKAIGILGAEVYDVNRDKINVLAFRAFRQRYAYYPDSTPTAFDKKNLRDGHYAAWSPTVYITAVDGTGVPTGVNAKYLIDLVLGNTITPKPDVDGLSIVISKGVIPDCAMKVSRAFDGGDLTGYSPAGNCTCFYESKTPGSTSTCTACTDDTACGTGKCRRGVCEAK